jgi:hypothetical protein
MSVQIEHSRTGGAGLGMRSFAASPSKVHFLQPNQHEGCYSYLQTLKNVYPLSPKLRGLLSFGLLVSAGHTVQDDHSLVTCSCAFKTRSITWHHLRQLNLNLATIE